MNNLIYNNCIALFASDSSEEQKKLYDEIYNEINLALKNGNDSIIAEALLLAEKENKVAIFNHINNMINFTVTTLSQPENDSHLFVFPIILQSPISSLTLPPIKNMEQVLRKNIEKYELTQLPIQNINFAPVLLGKKSVLNMNMAEWHKIHRATQSTLEKRHSRPMYENPFSIQLDNSSLQLFFLTFTVVTNKGEFPEFLNQKNINQDTLLLILNDFERFIKHFVPGTDCIALPFGAVNEIISNAFDVYQLLLTENLISQYNQDVNISFSLIPTNEHNSFALMAWNKETNNVLSALILNPYSKSLDDVVSDVLDLLNKYYVQALYIGETEISFDKFDNLSKIDFSSYLKKYGATVLKPE